MARQARGKSMDPAKVQVFHTVQRCVRRAFLCGEDAVSGKSYDHRKQWIRERLEFLASIFAIDLLTYTVLSNHLHLVMRSRPDVVAAWSNQEVVARYWRLHPQRKNEDGSAADPTDAELNIWLAGVAPVFPRFSPGFPPVFPSCVMRTSHNASSTFGLLPYFFSINFLSPKMRLAGGPL